MAWSNRPVAVLDGPESLPRVVASNEAAQLAGVDIGVTKAHAAQCPGIVLRKRIPQQEQAAQQALIDCAAEFSPRVESTSPGVVTLDIAGTERIFGPPQKLLRLIATQASRMGLEVNDAAAGNPDTALLVARGVSGTSVVPTNGDAQYLAQLPIDVLPLSADQAEILDSWGIRRCRDLALLPPVPLVERLGQTGLHLQKLVRGEVNRTLVPTNSPLKFRECLELEEPVGDLESLLFVVDRLLEQISARLASRSLATDELQVRLQLDIHQDRDVRKENKRNISDTFVRTLKLPVAMQDTKVLLKLLQLDLAQQGPGATVKAVEVEAHPARRRHTQASLFSAAAPEAEKLEITLARIRGVVGEMDERGRGRVGSAEVLSSHKPDDFRMIPFKAEDNKTTTPNESAPVVTLSIFRPLLTARVRCQAGKPVHIAFEEIASPIICAAGPWTTSGNWWKREEEWRREEWDIAIHLAGGVGLYRIFRDLRQGTWFVEGLYD